MGIEFQVGTNGLTQKPMVEVRKDGEFIANIYGHDGGLRVVSKHLDGVEHEVGSPPSVVIKFSNER